MFRRTVQIRRSVRLSGAVGTIVALTLATTTNTTIARAQTSQQVPLDGVMRLPDAYQRSLVRFTQPTTLAHVGTQNIKLVLDNPGDSTANVTLRSHFVLTRATGPDHTLAPEVHDSAGMPSLVPWMTGVPDTLTLAPHEKRTITVHLAIPDTLSPGVYWADVIAHMPPFRAGFVQLQRFAQHRIFFVKGDTASTFAVGQRPVTDARICVDMAVQTGAAFFGTLHLALQDSAGNPFVVPKPMLQRLSMNSAGLGDLYPDDVPFTADVPLVISKRQSTVSGCIPLPSGMVSAAPNGNYLAKITVTGGSLPGIEKPPQSFVISFWRKNKGS